MFAKIFTSSILVMGLLSQVNAHAAVAPALGVAGTPVRNDVKKPTTAAPCGAGVNIAAVLDSSTAVAASAAGVVDTTAIDFNAGADGSREVTAKVDATGTGKSFVAMTVTTNGDAAPKAVGSQPIVATLPAGTKCTGGATKDKCLVQFVTSAGFGNCVAVTQGAAAAAAPAAAAAGGAAAAGAAAGAATGAATAKAAKKGAKKAAKKAAKRAAGSRAARALLSELEARGEEAVEVVKRSIGGWIWA